MKIGMNERFKLAQEILGELIEDIHENHSLFHLRTLQKTLV